MNEYIIITELYSLHGDVTHYAHFNLSVLIPLILYDYKVKKNKLNVTYIINKSVKDLEPLTEILFQLPIKLEIITNEDLLKNKFKKIKLKEIKLDLYDVKPYLRYLDMELVKKAEHLDFKYKPNDQINNNIEYNLKNIRAKIFTYNKYLIINKYMKENIKNVYNKYDIIIIDRKTNNKYKNIKYNNPKYEKVMKTSGSERRTITNIIELYNLIKYYFPKYSCKIISLENKNIFEQYYLFNNAQIVIAQHGAALANVIFMKTGKTVIEITPENYYYESNFCNPLCNVINLKHLQYITKDTLQNPNIKINISDFKKYLDLTIPKIVI